MRRIAVAALVAVGIGGWTSAGARGAEIVTWKTTSRYVSPPALASLYNTKLDQAEPSALRVNVFLPDGYAQHPGDRYPLLLLLHGQGDGYDTWAKPSKGNLLGTAKGFPGVIVMPEGDRGYYTNWWNGGRMGDPQWERYHLDELLPLIEQRLRIRPERRWHAIAGLSMGGFGTMYYASQRPGYFGSAAAFSGVLSTERPTFQQAFGTASGEEPEPIWGDPERQAFYWAGHNPVKLVANLRYTRLFVAAGNGVADQADELGNIGNALAELELGQQAQEFASAAEDQGLDVAYRPHFGVHDWPYWRADLRAAIRWDPFKEVVERPASWTYRTVSRFGRAWDLRFGFDQQPSEVITFKRDGNRLSAFGSGRVTLRLVGAGRPAFTETLPFSRELPAPRAAG
jgi:S-formylglutathione hydrolase FrmB